MTFLHARPSRLGLPALLVLVTFFGLLLGGCGSSEPEQPESSPAASRSGDSRLLSDNGLDGLGAREIIDRLDAMPIDERPRDLIASVEPDRLVLTDGAEREASLPMPKGEVYISVAPYRTETHECHFHSLTTCLGELGNTEAEVTLTGKDGKVLLDGKRRIFGNGFIGFWMPRGIRADLKIRVGDRTATETISTVEPDDRTCVTTMKLT